MTKCVPLPGFGFVRLTMLGKFPIKAFPSLFYAESQANHLFRSAVQTFFLMSEYP